MADNNNPIPTGISYIWTYVGALNTVEEVLNVTMIIFLAVSTASVKANMLCAAILVAAVTTFTFIILHIKGIIRRSKLAWHWMEFISVLIIALLLASFASIVISELTKVYIILGIMGYLTSAVYFIESFQRYRLAMSPVTKYAWTTPNMPELN